MGVADIVAAEDLRYKTIEVPEWDAQVRLGSLNAGLWIEFHRADDQHSTGVHLLAHALVDAEGTRLWTPDLVAQLLCKDKKVIGRLVDVALEMNGMRIVPTDPKSGRSVEPGTDVSPTV